MEVKDKMQVSVILRDYKTDAGAVNFNAVLAIPRTQRIPQLAQEDFRKTIALMTVALYSAFEGMNLKRGMNDIQILDLAEMIIDTSSEDNLSLEDLMLFLQKLVRGEYGVNYESMDIPKFMDKFEIYRELRWQQLNEIRRNEHLKLKSEGETQRASKNDELSEHFASMGDRMSELKNELKKTRQENKNLKMDNL